MEERFVVFARAVGSSSKLRRVSLVHSWEEGAIMEGLLEGRGILCPPLFVRHFGGMKGAGCLGKTDVEDFRRIA